MNIRRPSLAASTMWVSDQTGYPVKEIDVAFSLDHNNRTILRYYRREELAEAKIVDGKVVELRRVERFV